MGNTRYPMRLLLLLTLCLAACSRPAEPAAGVQSPGAAKGELFHDFGTIQHGTTALHEFVVDTRALGNDLVPLAVHSDCSCARTEMALRASDGSERAVTGQPLA